MASGVLQVFWKELTCSICMNYSIDAITMDCGHRFCGPVSTSASKTPQFLLTALNAREQHGTETLKQISVSRSWFSLPEKTVCDSSWALSPIGMGYTRRQSRSSVKTTGACLCALLAQEHEAHRHRPIEEAAEEHWVSVPLKTHFCKVCMKFPRVCFLGDWITLSRWSFQNLCPGVP